MKKSFMTRALAMGLSLAMAFSLSAATNVSVASAATAKPAMKSKSISVKVGQTKNYNATDATKKNYAIKNVKLSAEGKKAASVTWTAGKITVTGKAADSTKRNVKITFKNRKTKKNYYVTLKLVVKAAPEEQKPAVSTAAAITAIKQTSATKLAAEFSADMTGIKYTDLKIVRDETKAVVTVKSATVDKKDNTKVTIETYEALTDGKVYTVTYTAADEAKTESNANFTATAGVVADIALNQYSIPANTPTTIKYQLLDANGVLIEEKGIGKAKSDKVDVNIENFTGYQNDSDITLYNVGDTATLKLVYHTWKYNNTDGTEEGKVERELKITAVDQSSVIETYEYSVAARGSVVDFKRDTLKTQLAIDDDKDDSDPHAYFSFRKADGTDITTSLDYTVESGNENVLLANGTVAGGAQLTPVGVGATYLVIKNAKGSIVKTLPITVVAKRELSTMSVDKSHVTISKNATDAASAQKITIAVMDQYSDGYSKFTPATEPELRSGNKATQPDITVGTPNKNKVTLTVNADASTDVGTYSYTLDLTDSEKTTNVKKVSFSVTVSRVLENSTYAMVLMNQYNDITSKVDTTVGFDNYTNIVLRPVVVVKNNGVIIGRATKGSEEVEPQVVSIGGLTVKKGSTTVDAKKNVVYTVTNKNYDYAANGNSDAVINVAVGNGLTTSSAIVKNLDAGTYTVSLTARVLTTAGYKLMPMSTSFVVEDSQKVFEASVKAEKIEKNYTILNDVFEDTDYVKYSYAGHELGKRDGIDDYVYVSSKNTKVNDKSTRVEKVTMNVQLPGTSSTGYNNKYVQMTAPINRTFTFTQKPTTNSNVTATINTIKKYADKDNNLSSNLSPAVLADIIDKAVQVKYDYETLSTSEQTSVEEAKDAAIEIAQQAAVDIITKPAYYEAALSTYVFDILGYEAGTDYDVNDLDAYAELLAGEYASTSTSALSTENQKDVDDVKTVLENIFKDVKEAKDTVLKDYNKVYGALSASGSAVIVTKSPWNTVFPTFAEPTVTVTAQGIEALTTAGAVNVTSCTGLTVTTSSGVVLKVTASGNVVSGKGLKAVVDYDIVVQKAVTRGEGKSAKTVTFYASDVNKTTTKAATLKFRVTYTNNADKDKFAATVVSR